MGMSTIRRFVPSGSCPWMSITPNSVFSYGRSRSARTRGCGWIWPTSGRTSTPPGNSWRPPYRWAAPLSDADTVKDNVTVLHSSRDWWILTKQKYLQPKLSWIWDHQFTVLAARFSGYQIARPTVPLIFMTRTGPTQDVWWRSALKCWESKSNFRRRRKIPSRTRKRGRRKCWRRSYQKWKKS